MRRLLALGLTACSALAPLKSFGKAKGRGFRVQDKAGNANAAVVELWLGTAQLESATVGGVTRAQKCVQIDGCRVYGEMGDDDVKRIGSCLGVICPFAAITKARDDTSTRDLVDALEAARRGAYAINAEKVSNDAKEGPLGGAYKSLEKAQGAVGIFGLDESAFAEKATPANPLDALLGRGPASSPLAAAAEELAAAADRAEAELKELRDGAPATWNPFGTAGAAVAVDVGPRPNFWEVDKLAAWKLTELEARKEAEAAAAAARAAAEAAAEAASAEAQRTAEAEPAARADSDPAAYVPPPPPSNVPSAATPESDAAAYIPPADRASLSVRMQARLRAEDILREEDERVRREAEAFEASDEGRRRKPEEGRSLLEKSFAASPEAAPPPAAPLPPDEDTRSEFKRFLENRKKGGKDEDYWATRKTIDDTESDEEAEDAAPEPAPMDADAGAPAAPTPADDDDDDFLAGIKYKPPPS
jgi:hypothetical protein